MHKTIDLYTVFYVFCFLGSKDLQNVNITLRVLYRPLPSALPNIYTTLGQDYDDRVLPSITNEVILFLFIC